MKNQTIQNIMTWATLTVIVALLQGCSGSKTDAGYQTVSAEPGKDTELARQKNEEAVGLIEAEQFDEAETVLKQALKADITFGPAHNNLGKVYYHQSKFYLAAWEFQYAIKLMPYHPEPLNNLGLVLESVGRFDDAVAQYDDALTLEPDNPQFIGNFVRARLRRGDRDDQTRQLLSELILKDTRPAWVTWARQKLIMMQELTREQ